MARESLSETQVRLADAGFGDDLVATGSRLRSTTIGVERDPATLKAGEIVRFEGVSDPDEEAVLVAVSTRGGVPLGTFTTPCGPWASADQGEILRHLHRVVLSAEQTSEHGAHDHVVAVFADRVSAEAAASEDFDEHRHLRETRLQSREVLVVACAHDHEALVEGALQRHGGRLVPVGG